MTSTTAPTTPPVPGAHQCVGPRAGGSTADPQGGWSPRVELEPGLLIGTTDAEILQSFIGLVRGWRASPEGVPLPLRRGDVAILVGILGTDAAQIERQIVAATQCSPSAARRCRRLLLASLGVTALSIVAASIGGTSTYADAPAPGDAVPATSVAAGASTLRGDALDRGERLEKRRVTASATAAEAAPNPAAPEAGSAQGAATAAADPPPAPAIAALPQGSEAVLTIASVGIELPIFAGGQSVIDQGVVAHYWAEGWEPSVAAGAPGTYWLAAHHVTHGAPFSTLPDLAVGAEVRVRTSGATFVYTVTSTQVVGLLPGDEAVYGTDWTASTILLQTCVDSTRRVLVRGTLTATL